MCVEAIFRNIFLFPCFSFFLGGISSNPIYELFASWNFKWVFKYFCLGFFEGIFRKFLKTCMKRWNFGWSLKVLKNSSRFRCPRKTIKSLQAPSIPKNPINQFYDLQIQSSNYKWRRLVIHKFLPKIHSKKFPKKNIYKSNWGECYLAQQKRNNSPISDYIW